MTLTQCAGKYIMYWCHSLAVRYLLIRHTKRQAVIRRLAVAKICRHRYTVSQKNHTDVAHYDFNATAHQPILVILGRDVAERACYQMLICYPTSPN